METLTGASVTDREVNVARGKEELFRTGDVLEAAEALHDTGHVGKPPRIDVEVLIHLPVKGKSGKKKPCNPKNGNNNNDQKQKRSR